MFLDSRECSTVTADCGDTDQLIVVQMFLHCAVATGSWQWYRVGFDV